MLGLSKCKVEFKDILSYIGPKIYEHRRDCEAFASTSSFQCLKRRSDRWVNTLLVFPYCSLAFAGPTCMLLTQQAGEISPVFHSLVFQQNSWQTQGLPGRLGARAGSELLSCRSWYQHCHSGEEQPDFGFTEGTSGTGEEVEAFKSFLLVLLFEGQVLGHPPSYTSRGRWWNGQLCLHSRLSLLSVKH